MELTTLFKIVIGIAIAWLFKILHDKDLFRPFIQPLELFTDRLKDEVNSRDKAKKFKQKQVEYFRRANGGDDDNAF